MIGASCGVLPVVPLNDSNCHFTMSPSLTISVIKGEGVHDPLIEINNIWIFKCDENISTTIKHIYNYFANFIKIYDVDSGINDPSNLTEMVPVPEMEEMV